MDLQRKGDGDVDRWEREQNCKTSIFFVYVEERMIFGLEMIDYYCEKGREDE